MNVLADLGLEDGSSPMDIELAAGVHLLGRWPAAPDWCQARVRVAEIFDPADKLAAAGRRYRLTDDDRGVLADPAMWEGIAEFVVAVEVATLTVKRIERTVDEVVRSIEPTPEALASLFKRDENLTAFIRRCREADREIAAPKKEPAPSQPISSPAGARTAKAVEN